MDIAQKDTVHYDNAPMLSHFIMSLNRSFSKPKKCFFIFQFKKLFNTIQY